MDPIISPDSRFRVPEKVSVGEYSVIDDYCYFSTQLAIGRFCHIASGCSVAGGADQRFLLGDYSSISSGVKIWLTSDDFVNDAVVLLPNRFPAVKDHLISGDVACGRYTAIGANSVIMPRNELPEGTAVGALSFVPPEFSFEPWSVYAGSPIRLLKRRNRDNVLRQVEAIERYAKERFDG